MTSEASPPEVTSDYKSIRDISRSDEVGSRNSVASTQKGSTMPNSDQVNHADRNGPDADDQSEKNAYNSSNMNTETPASNGITIT